MRSKQLKWLYVAGFVVIVGLVVGMGVWWMSWGGEQEVIWDQEVISDQDGVEETEIRGEDREILSKVDTSDWQQYPADFYGVAFRYPDRIEILDTLSDLDLIDNDITIMSISKPVLISNVAIGYPEASLPIRTNVFKTTNRINGLDINLFVGEEIFGKKRFHAVVRSEHYLLEVMTFGHLDFDLERNIFSGVIGSLDLQ